MEEEIVWNNYIANTRLDLGIAAYSKVSSIWSEEGFVLILISFIFFTEGEGFLKIGERLFHPVPGELYLLPAGEFQAFGTSSEATFGKYWCHFSALIGDLHLLQIIKAPISVKVTSPSDMVLKFERLIKHFQSEEPWKEFRVRAILFDILADFFEQAEPAEQSVFADRSFEKMHAVLVHIDEHLAEAITIRQLAELVNFHPNYFIRIFKQVTGYSPIQYISRQRIEKKRSTCSPAAN